MAWVETQPGLHKRPLGPSENVMIAAISAERPIPREPVKIHNEVYFEVEYPVENVLQAFKNAWIALRLLKSPDIATSYGDDHKYYKVPTSKELETWASQTYNVVGTGSIVQSVVKELQSNTESMPMCYIVPEATTGNTFKGAMIIWISHWRTEAAGVFKVINQLFEYANDFLNGGSIGDAVSKHKFGDEVRLLTPALEDMMMPDQDTSAEAQARVDKMFEDYRSHLPSIDYPLQGGFSDPPTVFKVNQRTYTAAATSSLVDACGANSISVTAAVHSAFLGAVWKVADKTKQDRSYAIMMPAEVRKRLDRSSPFRDQGCWSAAQMLLLTIPSGQDFLTRAQRLRKQYGLAVEKTWLFEDMRATSESVIKSFSLAPAEPAGLPWFTSLGVLDGDVLQPEHGIMKISYVTAWADSLGPGIVFRMFTFRGRLNVHIAWNDSYHKAEQIDNTLNTIDEILLTELGVKMDIDEVRLMEY